MNESEGRVKKILKTSVIGIVVNALIATLKLVVGTIAGSIAIVLDGINNLADAGSSLITIIGTALAAKPADRKHPLGYGRMEYLSSLVISALILYAGVTSFIEAVKSILSPEKPDYDTLTLVIVVIAVFVKLFLALYTQKMGKEYKSDSLVASGKEAILDVVVSASTLVAAGIYITLGFGLEAYLGAIISLIIVKTGIELLGETVSKILGEPADYQLVKDIKKTIKEFDGVNGAYDLIMNNYGPSHYMASVHIEIDEAMDASAIDKLTREIMERIYTDYNVQLTAIGIYSKNRTNTGIVEMEEKIRETVLNREYVIGMHGFYADTENKHLRFDLVISLDAKNRREVHESAVNAVKELYPDYDYIVGLDMDTNEI